MFVKIIGAKSKDYNKQRKVITNGISPIIILICLLLQ